jgi:pyruvate/2-oxoglutarate dehydrogenase complex dihydrolipoamide acyltransferase (E2) component
MRALPLLLLALLASTAVRAAPEPAEAPAATPAEKAHGAVGGRLEPGANSFAAAQVRARFAEMGFADVADLQLDGQGIWRGRAEHAGRTLSVGMDFRGHVAAE